MYIMCVILCLFSALSRRVGALQISIIIIIIYAYPTTSLTDSLSVPSHTDHLSMPIKRPVSKYLASTQAPALTAATASACDLYTLIEPILKVSIEPRHSRLSPCGQTMPRALVRAASSSPRDGMCSKKPTIYGGAAVW